MIMIIIIINDQNHRRQWQQWWQMAQSQFVVLWEVYSSKSLAGQNDFVSCEVTDTM